MNIKISRLLILLTMLLGTIGGTLSAQQFSKAEETQTIALSADHCTITRDVDRNMLCINLDAAPYANVRSQQLIRITPVYISADRSKSLRLPKIYVAGNARYKVLKRQHDLYNSDPLVKEIYSRPEGSVYARGVKELPHMVYERPFESWMSRGHMELEIETYSCGNCPKDTSVAQGDPQSMPAFGPEDYKYNYIEPAATAFKEYAESFDANIQFVVDKHDLRKDFKNNAAELARLDEFVKKATKIEGAELHTVYIYGYASPEAPFDYNLALSDRRTKTLYNYVKSSHKALFNKVEVVAEGKGEDWDGLRKLVDASNMSERQTILDIIDKYDTDTQREADIKALNGGKVYRDLLDNYYPKLRHTTFTMSYRVRPFEVSELAHIYSTNAKLLSLSELYTLANQKVARGENPVAIYRTAYEQNPNDVVAKLNYANALLEYDKNAREAYSVLATIQSDSRAKLPTAIALDMMGRKAEAEELYFKL
ncbi:DUF3868 domain-containing protein [uncultured Porphyromonas sp.]|uniref:DUF3868 domain-containing protein n=1 Tax=uncultured Porphyromonas sp. TaxID=159274 RepID=UPI00260A2FAA|nr:DUF3868 domain-containing protein [uncultured Porphyromonas sp.]